MLYHFASIAFTIPFREWELNKNKIVCNNFEEDFLEINLHIHNANAMSLFYNSTIFFYLSMDNKVRK